MWQANQFWRRGRPLKSPFPRIYHCLLILYLPLELSFIRIPFNVYCEIKGVCMVEVSSLNVKLKNDKSTHVQFSIDQSLEGNNELMTIT